MCFELPGMNHFSLIRLVLACNCSLKYCIQFWLPGPDPEMLLPGGTESRSLEPISSLGEEYERGVQGGGGLNPPLIRGGGAGGPPPENFVKSMYLRECISSHFEAHFSRSGTLLY